MMSIFRDFQYLEGLYEVRTLIIIHGVSFFFFPQIWKMKTTLTPVWDPKMGCPSLQPNGIGLH